MPLVRAHIRRQSRNNFLQSHSNLKPLKLLRNIPPTVLSTFSLTGLAAFVNVAVLAGDFDATRPGMSLTPLPRFLLPSRARIRMVLMAVLGAIALGTIAFHLLEGWSLVIKPKP